MRDPVQSVQIRPFAERRDYERMIDYFLSADDVQLTRMGVDRHKLPDRDAWLESALLDHARGRAEKDRAYLAWLREDSLIGHSSINRIRLGEDAFIHLHLWVGDLRRSGLGTRYFSASAAEFMREFRLKRLFCEPYAENAAPNRVLLKCGFRFVKRYRTTPGAFTYEQDVNQYVLEAQPAPSEGHVA
jgi:RimJ/RimL family protein N-acetyltransferase